VSRERYCIPIPGGQSQLFQVETEDASTEGAPGAVPLYRASKAQDGTYTIFDVPIFAAHVEERADGREIDFGSDWLHGALDTARRRQAEGYMAPLHVRHHGDGEVEAAGKFRMHRVGKITHDGQEVDALFADLVGVRPEIFQRIMRGELSYRSVEILDVNRQEVDSLALLDDEVPFFRFPLLRVAVDREPSAAVGGDALITLAMSASGGPARYYTASGAGRGTAALFRFKEQTMTIEHADAKATDPTTKAANAEQLLMQIFSMLQQAMGPQAQQPEPPAQAPQAPMAAMQPPMQPQQGPGPVEQQPPVQRATPIGSVMGQFNATTRPTSVKIETPTENVITMDYATEGAVDGMAARMAALEAKFSAADHQNSIERRATELATRGFSAEQVSKFRGVASEHGLDGANVYAQALEDHGPSVPPAHWTGEIHGEAPDDPAVSKFAAQGPEALAKARELHSSWRRTGSTVDFETYYQINSNPDAYLGIGR